MKKLILFCLVLFLSCKKTNINQHEEWIGSWQGSTSDAFFMIEVKSDGNATYSKTATNANVNASGVFVLEGNTLSIGIKKLNVNQFPSSSNSSSRTTVILDDVTYFKQ